jgi:glycine cleavage system aminomethyltransferase T
VTADYAVLSVIGPASGSLMQSLSEDDDWSREGFTFGTACEAAPGDCEVFAQRVSYVGELGWELYVPMEQATVLFRALMRRGAEHGLKLCGYHALESCRLEKAYRSWGHDINDGDGPAEAGLAFCCKPDKAVSFIGRDAMLGQREAGMRRRLLQFRLIDPEPLVYHDEPIWRSGERVGYVTSGAYGHTLGASVALGWVTQEPGTHAAELLAADWQIEIAGVRHASPASLKPMYDPTGERLRA